MDLTELEHRQTRILQRISFLENSVSCLNDENQQFDNRSFDDSHANGTLPTEQRLGMLMRARGVTTFQFKRVVSDYYDLSFEERRDILGAHSIDHLCKSIVMVNTQADENIKDCSDHNNSKYYVIVNQYNARLNAEKVRTFVHSLNKGKIPKKRFNMRLAPEEVACELTGYVHNAVTPIGMKTDIPVILSDAIVKLRPDYFWLGGGEVDVKLGIKTQEFIDLVKPFIVDCS